MNVEQLDDASRFLAEAGQSQWLLDGGRKLCFLDADLDNPTSNSIYQRIVHRMVAESADYRFNP